MKVLVIGGGGREHALAYKAAQSDSVSKVYVAPGNAGTANENKMENVAIAADAIEELKQFAINNQIDLTIVGPEQPLVDGVVDSFTEAKLKVFGPTASAAQLEGSKSFSKEFLKRHNIPTAAYECFTDVTAAKEYIHAQGAPIVVKADGLAAGKGVIVAMDEQTAIDAVEDMLAGNRFGDAGHRVVIEQFLQGEEASFIVMVDGDTALPFATSQDHKRAFDGDEGPNTGGMGAYSPAPVVTPEVYQSVMEQIIEPTVNGMKQDGMPYVGFLYAGLMISEDGQPYVIEFNCRFGDPETQPIMMRLESDLVQLCLSALDGDLANEEILFSKEAAVGVVLAAGGYPDAYDKGLTIQGLDKTSSDKVKIFHAGTKLSGEDVLTNGGRVLCVTALGTNVLTAKNLAYEEINQISWPKMQYRSDIAFRAIKNSD